jgi:hypothetical protein
MTAQMDSGNGKLQAQHQARVAEAIAALRALRARPDAKPVTVEEILAWRHEGHDR